MVADGDLVEFMRTICSGDDDAAAHALTSTPELATAQIVVGATRASSEDFFLAGCGAHVYSGHTALHVAAAAYDTDLPVPSSMPVQTYGHGTDGVPSRSTRRSTACPDRRDGTHTDRLR
jgi:hypothetical protein